MCELMLQCTNYILAFVQIYFDLDFEFFKDATFQLLKGLEPGKKYKVMVTADYGDIKSKPRNASFTMGKSNVVHVSYI